MVQVSSPRKQATNKYEGVASRLRQQVRQLQPGDPLPSMRQLMRDYGVSQATLYRALDLLKGEAQVVQTPSGSLRAPDPDQAGGRMANVLISVAQQNSPFHQHLVEALTGAGRSFNFRCTLGPVEEITPEDAQQVADYDAAIILPGPSPISVKALAAWTDVGVPVLVTDRDMRQLEIDSACSNNRQAGILAARHLLAKGHRRLAVMVHDPRRASLEDRAAGFIEAVNMHGDGARVEQLVSDRPLYGDALCEFIRDLWNDLQAYTALFALTHTASMAALRQLYEMGVRVPDRISIVGFDDFMTSSYLCPPLTTVDQDLGAMAEQACRILRQRLDGDQTPVHQGMIEPRLVVRKSTGAPFQGEPLLPDVS